MAKYRRKPLIVEAFRFTRESILAEGDGEKLPDWVQQNSIIGAPNNKDSNNEVLFVTTLIESMNMALQGDWLVKDSEGRIEIITPDIFPEIYELVEEEIDGETELKFGLDVEATLEFSPPSRLTISTTSGESDVVIDFSGPEIVVTGASEEGAKVFFEDLLKPMMADYIKAGVKEE